MRCLAIIPARYASTRFPGKPLIDLGGKTMIERVYNNTMNAGVYDEVWVATDDDRIFDHVQAFGGAVKMTSTLAVNGTARCAEAIGNRGSEFDIIVNVQGDEPFANIQHHKKIVALFERPEVSIGTLYFESDSVEEFRNPNRVKIALTEDGRALYFSRTPIAFGIGDPNMFRLHIGMYAFRPVTLLEVVRLKEGILERKERLEQLRWLEHGYNIHCAKCDGENLSVDTPEDAEVILEKIYKGALK